MKIWIANIMDLIFGDPYNMPHPVRVIGSYISWFEKIIRKICRSDSALKIAGIILTISTVAIGYGTIYFILKFSMRIGLWLNFMLSVIFMYYCIAGKCLQKEAYKIMSVLFQDNLPEARKLLSYIVGRDTGRLDEEGIARGLIETVSENTSDGIIAPLFYMFIGGPPLAMAYKAINTLDSMVGYKNDKYKDFGWASAKLDDIANYIPARLTAIFMVASAFILGKDYKNSFRIVLRDGRKHLSPNSGYPEAAVAGALGIMLGGANYYFGKLVVKPTIGDKSKVIEAKDIKHTVKIMYVSWLMALILFSIAAYLLKGI
ncbi:adenosylcobinamide-phosphate synthase CbiB [Lutispora thermophila]|uniref:adenosylcobinamide-phosphate synthase CbiB n=1 Tax=Lutispora thermophila TaxID=288966 RepID=UPI000934FAE3